MNSNKFSSSKLLSHTILSSGIVNICLFLILFRCASVFGYFQQIENCVSVCFECIFISYQLILHSIPILLVALQLSTACIRHCFPCMLLLVINWPMVVLYVFKRETRLGVSRLTMNVLWHLQEWIFCLWFVVLYSIQIFLCTTYLILASQPFLFHWIDIRSMGALCNLSKFQNHSKLTIAHYHRRYRSNWISSMKSYR